MFTDDELKIIGDILVQVNFKAGQSEAMINIEKILLKIKEKIEDKGGDS